jgi:hypothetical protein
MALPDSAPTLQQRWGLAALPLGLQGAQLHYTQMLVPTCSITRLEGVNQEYRDDDHMPAEARAWLDFHLVPRQTPEEIFTLLRGYLDAQGFQDIELHQRYGYQPAAPEAAHTRLLDMLREATRLAYGTPPRILPMTLSSQPLALVRSQLQLPIIITTLVGAQMEATQDQASIDAVGVAAVKQTALFIASAAQFKA